MKSNFYSAIFADGKQIMQGVLRARNGDHARDVANVQAGQLVDFERFPHVRWDIVVSERPFPKGIHVETCEHGHDFLIIPVELAKQGQLISVQTED